MTPNIYITHSPPLMKIWDLSLKRGSQNFGICCLRKIDHSHRILLVPSASHEKEKPLCSSVRGVSGEKSAIFLASGSSELSHLQAGTVV